MASRAPGPAFAVDDQRDAAVGTVHRPRALTAEHGGREAAPVQQHERLLLAIEPGGNGVLERAAEDHVRARRSVLLAHVDDGHGRERPIEHAPLEDDALVPPFIAL